MTSPTAVLDERLPLLQPHQIELHNNAAILEVSHPTQLIELATNSRIRRYLLARLSDTVALVDPGEVDALVKVLRAEGHTPRMEEGLSS